MESWMHHRIIVARREILANSERFNREPKRAITIHRPYRALVFIGILCGELVKLAVLEAFEEYYDE